MHLSRKADTGNRIPAKPSIPQSLADSNPSGPPPVFRPLFRPPNLRRSKRLMLLGSRRNNLPRLINNQSPSPTSPNINSQNVHMSPSKYLCHSEERSDRGTLCFHGQPKQISPCRF